MSALSNTAPLCIAQAYARSRFGPVNGKHLQETLPPPPPCSTRKARGFTVHFCGFWSWLVQLSWQDSVWSKARRLADGRAQLLPFAPLCRMAFGSWSSK